MRRSNERDLFSIYIYGAFNPETRTIEQGHRGAEPKKNRKKSKITGAWSFVLKSLLYPQNQRITISWWSGALLGMTYLSKAFKTLRHWNWKMKVGQLKLPTWFFLLISGPHLFNTKRSNILVLIIKSPDEIQVNSPIIGPITRRQLDPDKKHCGKVSSGQSLLSLLTAGSGEFDCQQSLLATACSEQSLLATASSEKSLLPTASSEQSLLLLPTFTTVRACACVHVC